jgi:hypothetical protein
MEAGSLRTEGGGKAPAERCLIGRKATQWSSRNILLCYDLFHRCCFNVIPVYFQLHSAPTHGIARVARVNFVFSFGLSIEIRDLSEMLCASVCSVKSLRRFREKMHVYLYLLSAGNKEECFQAFYRNSLLLGGKRISIRMSSICSRSTCKLHIRINAL